MAKKPKKADRLPGIECKSDTACKQRSAKICGALLQGQELPWKLPKGLSRVQAAEFCAKNQLGKPFEDTMMEGARSFCEGTRSVKACRDRILASNKTALGTGFKMSKVVSKSSPLITSTLKGKPLVPWVQKKGKALTAAGACRPPGGNAARALRDCHYELEFYNEAQLKMKGLKSAPGAYLRVCGAKALTNGSLFHVKSPDEAQAIMDKHCDCKKGGGSPDQCAPPKPAGFGKYFKRSGSKAFRNSRGLHGYGKR